MVEGVPKEMRSDSKLFTYFNTLYPDEVRGVCFHEGIADCSVFPKALKKCGVIRGAVSDVTPSRWSRRRTVKMPKAYSYGILF